MHRSLGWRTSVALGALVGASLAVVTGGEAAGTADAATPTVFSGVETRLSTSIGDEYDPAISGDVVVYTSYRGPGTDVYWVDLATGQEHQATAIAGNQELTDVSRGRIVYTDLETLDVVLFDIATGTRTVLTPDSAVSINPAIGGDLVAWEDVADGNQNIGILDLATGERRVAPASASPAVDAKPAIDQGVVTWESCDPTTCDVLAYDWSTGVSASVDVAADVDARRPDVSGRTIVYQRAASGESDIAAFDLDTGVTRVLSLPGTQVNPNVSGHLVAFETLVDGVYHVALWDLADGQVYSVTGGAGGQFLNDIDGDRIAYSDDRDGQLDVYLTRVTLTPVLADHVTVTLSGGYSLRLDGDLTKGALRLVTANGRPAAIVGAGQMPGTVAGRPATIGLLLGRVGTSFTGVLTISDPGSGFNHALTYTGTATLTDPQTATGHGTVTDPLARGRNKVVATIDWTIHDAA